MARKPKEKVALDVPGLESELAKANRKIRELQEEIRMLKAQLSDTQRSSSTRDTDDDFSGSAFYKMT